MRALWPERWDDSALHDACAQVAVERRLSFLYLREAFTFTDWVAAGGMPTELPREVVLLVAPGPLAPRCLIGWREGLSQLEPPVAFRFVRLPLEVPTHGWRAWLDGEIGSFGTQVQEEATALQVGSLVQIPVAVGVDGRERGYEPYVLAIPPDGPLAPVLARLDAIRRTFEAMRPRDLEEERLRIHRVLDALIHDPTPSTQDALQAAIGKSSFSRCDRTQLPRVLLLGESGTGKSVLSRYLATHQIARIPFDRVPIPEYLGREDHFESDVFGYAKGAYTGARDEGSRGALGELIGGVVFFDEIGDASPMIQAKLLAYLDDYVVKPRGLAGRGYYCPTLVVAATNRDVHRATNDDSPGLRRDLLNRFNEVISVPSLSERLDEIDLQVDLLLQQEAQGSSSAAAASIRCVGVGALERIRSLDFQDKNFRLLERVLSTACKRARSERRDYLVASDIMELR